MEFSPKNYQTTYRVNLYKIWIARTHTEGGNAGSLCDACVGLADQNISYFRFREIVKQSSSKPENKGFWQLRDFFEEISDNEIKEATRFLLSIDGSSAPIKTNARGLTANNMNRISRGQMPVSYDIFFYQVVIAGLQRFMEPSDIILFIRTALKLIFAEGKINDVNHKQDIDAKCNEIKSLLGEPVFSYTRTRLALKQLLELLSFGEMNISNLINRLMMALEREEKASLEEYRHAQYPNADPSKLDPGVELLLAEATYNSKQPGTSDAIKLEMAMSYLNHQIQPYDHNNNFQKVNLPVSPDDNKK